MGQAGLCHFDNALQDGDNAGVAEMAHSCCHTAHSVPDLTILMFAVSTPAMEEEDILAGLPQRYLAIINTHA